MKNFLFALFILCFSCLTINGLNAQSLNKFSISAVPKADFGSGQLINPVKYTLHEAGEISAKALKSFAKTYQNVGAVTWTKIKGGYCAQFILNGEKNAVFYNMQGQWSYSIRSYYEEKLPYRIRNIVKRKYYDYSIFFVEELETINSNCEPTYLIHLEGKNTFKLVRVYDGEMEVWEDLMKYGHDKPGADAAH